MHSLCSGMVNINVIKNIIDYITHKSKTNFGIDQLSKISSRGFHRLFIHLYVENILQCIQITLSLLS